MKCKECGGTGVTDNHVTGEVCCSACDGSGVDDYEEGFEEPEKRKMPAPAELLEILSAALASIKSH